VAFYPNCRFSTGVMTTPLLILMGSADDWTQVAACRAMLDRRAGRGAKVQLVVYPGATHAFDVPARAHTTLGHHIRYDPSAARAAWGQVRAFLAAAFARALPRALPGGRVAPK
jgi:dienelactone hydrolase